MGSYLMRDGVHDFDFDASNDFKDTRKFADSGSTAGVESGLGSVTKLTRGAIDTGQETVSGNFKPNRGFEAASGKGGKKFTIQN